MGIRNGWLSTAEYAETIGITQQTVRQWAATGRIESRRVGRKIEVRDPETRSALARAISTARELAQLLSAVDARLALRAQELARELDPIGAQASDLADSMHRDFCRSLTNAPPIGSIAGLAAIVDDKP